MSENTVYTISQEEYAAAFAKARQLRAEAVRSGFRSIVSFVASLPSRILPVTTAGKVEA
jgi:hypothetical protein